MSIDRAGDVLGGPADATRPSNPWPRILAFALVVAIGIGLAAVCIVSFASPPPREVRVPVANLQPGAPVFTPVTTFGNDRQQRTYGVWTGIGAVGTAVLGMVLFQEPATLARIACIGLIVAGIAGLKLTSA